MTVGRGGGEDEVRMKVRVLGGQVQSRGIE